MKNTRRDHPVAHRDGANAVRARAGNRTVTRFKCLAVTMLLAASSAHGYLGTFDPDLHEYTGPQLVTFVDSNAAPLECIGLAADIGDVGGAVLGLLADGGLHRPGSPKIIAPLPGAGQLIAAVGAGVPMRCWDTSSGTRDNDIIPRNAVREVLTDPRNDVRNG
jgi:hypothetical protein